MNVNEMHVQLDFIVQGLNSNIYSNLLPEEKDIILDKAQNRFIRNVTDPQSNLKGTGLAWNLSRYDDIEELLTKVVLPSYVNTSYLGETESVFSVLPFNYLRLVDLRSKVLNLCNDEYSEKVTTTQETLILRSVPFTNNSALFTIFKLEIVPLVGANIVIFDITNYPSYVGLSSNDEKFILINLVLSETNKKLEELGYTYKLYYEHYDNYTNLNNFILVSDNQITRLEILIQETRLQNTTKTIVRNKISNNLENYDLSVHRVMKPNDVGMLLETSFGTTIFKSPLTEFQSGRLIHYHKKKFIISDVLLSYIRKPRQINVNLNISCELNPNVHDKIVDIAAKLTANYLNIANQRNISIEEALKE